MGIVIGIHAARFDTRLVNRFVNGVSFAASYVSLQRPLVHGAGGVGGQTCITIQSACIQFVAMVLAIDAKALTEQKGAKRISIAGETAYKEVVVVRNRTRRNPCEQCPVVLTSVSGKVLLLQRRCRVGVGVKELRRKSS